MNKNFTYIIRSNDREDPNENTNSCTIKLYGLPQQYRYFKCDVIALYITTENEVFTTSLIDLRGDGIDIMNGWDTNNKRNATVGFATLNNTYTQSALHTFTCGNFNGRTVTFKLYDDDNDLLTSNLGGGGIAPYDSPWVLVLNMTGIEE